MTKQELLDYQVKIVKIIEIFFPNAKVYLFGSRARGDYDVHSDFDIAIDIGKQMPLTEKGKIMGMIDLLNIPQRVEIVDMYAIPKEMQNNILKDGIVWKN